MSKQTSLYLDLIRIFAALAVLFSHLKRDSFSGGNSLVLFLAQFGQEGVSIFFVISGIVIAYVARHRDRDMRSFFVARLGRLWSVMLPALALTVVLDLTGAWIAPAMYAEPGIPSWGFDLASLWNALAPAVFLNKVSFADVEPGTNGPFWSLCYEFWYYAIFAFAYYLRGWTRIIVVVLAMLVAGDAILNLLPMWALGLLVYALLGRFIPARWAACLFFASLSGLAVLMVFKYRIASATVAALPALPWAPLELAVHISHFGIAALIGLNILGFDRMPMTAWLLRLERPVRYLAARSFSLYLYQAPLLFFFGALTMGMASSDLRLALILAATLASVALLSELTERRKHLFTRFADWLLPKSQASIWARAV